jgi:anti-sigma factor RsiW
MKWMRNRCCCRQDISLLAADALDQEEKIALERHLAACEECRTYYSEIKLLTAPLADWERNLSAVVAAPAARMRWAKAVQEAEQVSAPNRNPNPQRLRLGLRLRLRIGMGFWPIVWGELIWPSRYAWTGMAALWVAMLAINGSLANHQRGAGDPAASSQEMMQAWADQNRVLAELVQPAFTIPAPPRYVPGPRSERKQDCAII